MLQNYETAQQGCRDKAPAQDVHFTAQDVAGQHGQCHYEELDESRPDIIGCKGCHSHSAYRKNHDIISYRILLLAGTEHEPDARYYEGDAQQLAHIQAHTLLKIHLNLLTELNEETERENGGYAEPEIEP